MADTITIRTDEETEHALDVLTRDGTSRSAAVRQALIEAASRRERAARMRREVLRMDIGQPDGGNVAEELARDRRRALMIYLDSAAVVRLAHAEAESPALRAWLDEQAESGWVSSVLTESESFHALPDAHQMRSPGYLRCWTRWS
jgi:predicted transcriptional regulator